MSCACRGCKGCRGEVAPLPAPLVFETTVMRENFDKQDSGAYYAVTVPDAQELREGREMWVNICSHIPEDEPIPEGLDIAELRHHPVLAQMLNRRVRVTVEILEDV